MDACISIDGMYVVPMCKDIGVVVKVLVVLLGVGVGLMVVVVVEEEEEEVVDFSVHHVVVCSLVL